MIEIPQPILIVFAFALALIAIVRISAMLANLIAQINRLRDEILPALTSALAVIATLRADNATLTAERDAAVARITELENGIPQAATDLTAINDQLAALAA